VRILFLNDLWDPRIGSSIRQMYRSAERLRELGHETAVVSTTEDRALVGETEIEGTRVWRLHSSYPPRFRAWVSTRNARVIGPLGRLLDAWRPDVVHSHIVHTHLSYAALGEARSRGAAVVFTAHDSMTFCYQKLDCFHGGAEHGWQLKDYRAYWQKCLPCQRLRWRPDRNRIVARVLARDVDRFTTVSHELAASVGANGIRVDRVIHNAIRLAPARPTPAQVAAFRARFGLGERPVIAMGGRLHELKGVLQLFEMLAVLRREFPEIRLLVMGKEDAWRHFEPAARERGVHDLVVPTGWLDGADLAAGMAAQDVMVSPSTCFETFGMMALEAMEHQKPVVVSSFGGCPETVRQGETGLVANPFHVAEYAEAIAALLRDPERRRAMGAAGRAWVASYFTIERLVDEFLEEYERARELRRAPAPRAAVS
jgi:glycosyltransferase involved in cell wall biosynthesis